MSATPKKIEKKLTEFKTFPEKLGWLMKQAGITQVELARKVKITTVWMNNIAQGHRTPSDTLIQRLAKQFGVRPVLLFDESRRRALGI